MVNKKAKGKRGKTRSKLKKKAGKATVNQLLRPFKEKDKVQVDIKPEMHGGMPASIYQGVSGFVEGKQGGAYRVKAKKGKLEKTLLVQGIHLREERVSK